ncbi:MAG: LytR/AlgR family response regulator transcription factor [Gemmatimonadaceae bacterium]
MLALRVCIADPNQGARSLLASVVARLDACTIVAECDDAAATTAAVRRWSPNVVVADSRLPPTGVFALMRDLSATEPVFVLAAEHHRDAMRAFSSGAVDCIAKPIDPARCRLALDRARTRLVHVRALTIARELSSVVGTAPPATDRSSGSYLTQLHIPGARAAMIPATSIDWIAAEDCYSRVFVDRASFLLRRTLGAIERQLDPREFVRTHRSAIVNARRVADVSTGPDGDTTLVLSSGTIVPVSQRRRSTVLRALSAREHDGSGHPWRSAPIV